MLTSTETAWLSTPATEAEPTCASMNASRTGHTPPEGARRLYADGGRGAEPYSNGTAGGFLGRKIQSVQVGFDLGH